MHAKNYYSDCLHMCNITQSGPRRITENQYDCVRKFAACFNNFTDVVHQLKTGTSMMGRLKKSTDLST